jgi:hypothetical protein
VPQDFDCNFLHEHTEATATCNIYINRLLVVNYTKATTTFISYRLHVPTDPLASVQIFYESTPTATLDGRTRQ